MRALRFMKIDYIKTKQQVHWFPFFWGIAFLFAFDRKHFGGEGSLALVGAFSYLMFMAIVFCTVPFEIGGGRREAGFTILLPSRTVHRIGGRFLYGLSLIGIELVIMGIIFMIRSVAGQEISELTFALCLTILSVAIAILSLEFGFLYLVGEHMAPQFLSIVRIAPGMALFFGINYFINLVTENQQGDTGGTAGAINRIVENLEIIGWCSAAAAAVLLIMVIAVCIWATEKRDYS